jgi:hypothetical protein
LVPFGHAFCEGQKILFLYAWAIGRTGRNAGGPELVGMEAPSATLTGPIMRFLQTVVSTAKAGFDDGPDLRNRRPKHGYPARQR